MNEGNKKRMPHEKAHKRKAKPVEANPLRETGTQKKAVSKRPGKKQIIDNKKQKTIKNEKTSKQESFPTVSSNKKKKRKKLTLEQIQQRKKQQRRATRNEVIKFMVPVILVAVVLFFFILNTSPHMVDGDSMSPTLVNKDRVVVRRTKELKRYEIITFKPPVDSKYQYVKRIIGMPGDSIWLEGNALFINHQSEEVPEDSDRSNVTVLPDGTFKINVSDTCVEQLKNLEKIPEGYYFVLGDNRNNSSDSRVFGLVDGQAVEGVVSFRYLPFKEAGFIK